jgi:23S rRNA G2445 N2-methylase RlmL
MNPGKIIITTSKGLVPCLKGELAGLNYPVTAFSDNHVETSGSLADTMRMNLWLRTAFHVLYFLEEFPCNHPDDLYRKVREMEWEKWLDPKTYLSVTSTVDHPSINDSRFPNLRCKDAIVDRLRDKTGARPDSGPEMKGAVIRLFWKERKASLYIDTSGEPLTRRGYRKIPVRAPLQETLAAAILLSTGWDLKSHFINPMCGSGTLAIEAALLALKRAPGLSRQSFGFQHIIPFDGGEWGRIRAQAKELALASITGRILCSDLDSRAVDAARRNAKTAGVDQVIEFQTCDFAETPIPEGGGVLVLNPEYGMRLGIDQDLEKTYARIGDFLKQKCAGYKGFVFSGNLDLLKKIGLKSSRRIPFFNAKIECRLVEYLLYRGSLEKSGHTA